MGYRSDVELLVSNAGYTELKEFIIGEGEKYYKANPDSDEETNFLDFADEIENKGTYTKIYQTWVKYYDDFPEVQIFEDALTHLEKNGYSYRFARIGDDTNDNTVCIYDGENDADISLPNLWIRREFVSE